MKVKLKPGAIAPTRATAQAAGLDLYSPSEGWVRARGRGFVDTGVCIQLQPDEMGEVKGRSGLSRRGLMVTTGTIDSDYRGSIGIMVYNLTDDDYHIRRGDRIAQLTVLKVCRPDIEIVDELDDTERGEAGFGSTGR